VKIATTEVPQRQPINTPQPNINIVVGADTVVIILGIIWFAWEKFVRSRVVTKLDGIFAPVEEERRLNNTLAQIGIITQASRVILTAFHNGQIDSYGYHLTKISTINSYVAPGGVKMAKPIRDLPLGRIMYEIEQMLQNRSTLYTVTAFSDDMPDPCKDHLRSNRIGRMYNKLVKIGSLPIGILSIQYHENDDMDKFIFDEPYAGLLSELYNEIAVVMRRRVVRPGPLKQFFAIALMKNRKTPI
jgi:hypothetical protein